MLDHQTHGHLSNHMKVVNLKSTYFLHKFKKFMGKWILGLLWFIFIFVIHIKDNDILELLQGIRVLNLEKIMHEVWLHMAMFNWPNIHNLF
jgi:hypothetical protein